MQNNQYHHLKVKLKLKYSEQIEIAFKAQKPFVAFKNPNESMVNVMIQQTNDLVEFNDFTKSGYVFAPFNSDETAYLIQPDLYFKDKIEVFDVKSEGSKSIPLKQEQKSHIKIVKKAVETIKETKLTKVVISRSENVLVPKFDLMTVYNRLLNKYTNAYVYVWYHPKVGLWMGATPETLLRVKSNSFKTMALAGTQSFNGDLNPSWGSKEIEEQQMVSSFIKKHLKHVVKDLRFSAVETVRAGSLLHLKTNISGHLFQAKDLANLVQLLHPTPAVCGLPKQLSKTFILNHENHHRSFYSGYLGMINMSDETSLFVNLRCFQMKGDEAKLYIGGGVTAHSDALKEWEETIAKSNIIKAVF